MLHSFLKNTMNVSDDYIKKVVNTAILKEEEGGISKEPSMFECGFCSQLVYKPQICGTCQSNLYCLACTKVMKKCGMCNKSNFVANNRIVQNTLMSKEIICKMQGCLLNGQSLSYEKLVKYHAPSCGSLTRCCPLC